MKNAESQLRSHSFVKTFSSETVDLLATNAKMVIFEPGHLILSYQQPAEHLWLLTEGQVVLSSLLPGAQKQTIETLNAPAVLGWSWLLEPYRWHFDATARHQVSAIEINAKVLREHMNNDAQLSSELYPKFFELVVERLQASRLQSLDIYQSSDHRGLHEFSHM